MKGGGIYKEAFNYKILFILEKTYSRQSFRNWATLRIIDWSFYEQTDISDWDIKVHL